LPVELAFSVGVVAVVLAGFELVFVAGFVVELVVVLFGVLAGDTEPTELAGFTVSFFCVVVFEEVV
jgi:hypothetical protein